MGYFFHIAVMIVWFSVSRTPHMKGSPAFLYIPRSSSSASRRLPQRFLRSRPVLM